MDERPASTGRNPLTPAPPSPCPARGPSGRSSWCVIRSRPCRAGSVQGRIRLLRELKDPRKRHTKCPVHSVAMPKLAVSSRCVFPGHPDGVRSDALGGFSCLALAWRRRSMTANSSPPNRAMGSCSRHRAPQRPGRSVRGPPASPAGWPKVSLKSLKWSMSRRIRDRDGP